MIHLMRSWRTTGSFAAAVVLSTACGLTLEGMGAPEPDTVVVPDGGSGEGGVDGFESDGGAARADASTDARTDAGLDANSTSIDAAATALSFDGTNDLVRIQRQVQDDFTLEAWMSTTSSRAGTKFYEGLPVIYADVSGMADDFATSILSGKFAFGVVSTTAVSTTTVTTGDWVHVAAVRVRSTGAMRVLVNGVEEASVNGSTASLDAPSTINFGGNTIDGRFYKGRLDEIRIWNVARTTAAIRSTMAVKLLGNEAGLVGYWRLDEGAGTVASDSSPSHNDGALGGATTSARPAWVSSGAF
jgi:hypothetical protein